MRLSLERIELAKALSRFAHAGQKDKSGADYYLHPLHVCESVTAEDEKIVALLHDVLEDTDVAPDTISNLFGNDVLDAVIALTRLEGETYSDFIKRAAKNPIAKTVKLADLEHNMDLGRLKEVTKQDLRRLKRYKEAKEYLESL